MPEDVPPGGSFTVHVWGKRKGERVAIAHKLWRASGQRPRVQQRVCRFVAGRRKAWAPHAIARRATGDTKARAIDNCVPAQAHYDNAESDQELPFEAHEEDIGWLPGPVNGSAGRPIPAFTGPPTGPANRRLTRRSSLRTIMKEVHLTDEFLDTVVASRPFVAAAVVRLRYRPTDGWV